MATYTCSSSRLSGDASQRQEVQGETKASLSYTLSSKLMRSAGETLSDTQRNYI